MIRPALYRFGTALSEGKYFTTNGMSITLGMMNLVMAISAGSSFECTPNFKEMKKLAQTRSVANIAQ
jgi:hypothetical protein